MKNLAKENIKVKPALCLINSAPYHKYVWGMEV
jgi:hypothetical protein